MYSIMYYVLCKSTVLVDKKFGIFKIDQQRSRCEVNEWEVD